MTSSPSAYEILLERSLSKGLRDAFRHLVKALASNQPDRFRLLHVYFDELSLLINFVFEGLHLRTYGATFAENYYHIQRERSSKTDKPQRPAVALSLIAISLLPYLRTKLDKFYEKLDDMEFNGNLNLENKPITSLFFKCYPIFKSIADLTTLAYFVRFAVEDSQIPSPLCHLFGIKFVRKNSNETDKTGFLPSLAKGVNFFLTSSALFIQFLDQWYSQESSRWPLLAVNIPDPPEERKLPNCSPGICPMCLKNRRNETVLRSSGIVFCYECILDFVQRYQKCPVTGYPTSANQLVRIYQSS